MKKITLWLFAFIITIGAAYYQRKTGPTYPKRTDVILNESVYELKLVRSLGLDERPEVKLHITDTTIKARIYYKRFRTNDDYENRDFKFKVYPVKSFIMNKIFSITEEKGFFAEVPQQPAAGKIEYYIDITDYEGTKSLFKENPIVIRFKGAVPDHILIPHVLLMFFAMLLSTLAGLMSVIRYPSYKKYAVWTLFLLIAGGMILGPLVQKFAFGELWTGVPFGWDLTDNKTLIATLFWVLAVFMNRKKERPIYAIAAAVVLLIVYSIPHSLFGSELDYASGQVIQGFILIFFLKKIKNFLN
ncbi:MAG TPA: hypothetical protein VMW32_11130 [Bacteroidales bacterium]|nr:hypothetical protein [Bacteroidales bacterium]